MKKIALAIPGFAAVASFASTGGTTTGVDWSNIVSNADFDTVISAVAPVAIAVVVAVAGVRVAIKLINRGAGK